MNNPDTLFKPDELMRFQMKLKQHLIAASKAPFIIAMTALATLVLAGVGYLEYEIIFRVFDYLSGDNPYWEPELMGLTAAVMVIGFHLLTKTNPGNIAVRFVNKMTSFLIPVYLLGIGLLIACILFADGLSSLLDSDLPLTIGGIPEHIDENWLDTFFSKITNPLAVSAFALGIGGLAIINIYVAHNLLKKIAENLDTISTRLTRAKNALKDHAIIRRAQREYTQLSIDIADLTLQNDHTIALIIAGEVLGTIADGLLPHKIGLKENEYRSRSSFEPQNNTDPKQVAKDIARIEAITQSDILNVIKPSLLEDLS